MLRSQKSLRLSPVVLNGWLEVIFGTFNGTTESGRPCTLSSVRLT